MSVALQEQAINLAAVARDDDVAYRDLVSRYRAMAESLGFEGHIAWAEALTESGG